MCSDRVVVEVAEGIATVKLNRPEKLNGLDQETIRGLLRAARRIASDRSVRVTILCAEGKSFSTGLDFSCLQAKPTFAPWIFVKRPLALMNRAQRLSMAWRDLPTPVIAVISGMCLGGGLQLAMGADFRFASPDAEFSILEISLGLVPDMGGTQMFSELIRIDRLKELALTGEFVTAQRAEEYGLVTRVTEDPMQEAMVLARKLMQRSPDALAATKKLFHANRFGTLRARLRRERWAQLRVLGRPNQKRAMENRGSKDVASFGDRSII